MKSTTNDSRQIQVFGKQLYRFQHKFITFGTLLHRYCRMTFHILISINLAEKSNLIGKKFDQVDLPQRELCSVILNASMCWQLHHRL